GAVSASDGLAAAGAVVDSSGAAGEVGSRTSSPTPFVVPCVNAPGSRSAADWPSPGASVAGTSDGPGSGSRVGDDTGGSKPSTQHHTGGVREVMVEVLDRMEGVIDRRAHSRAVKAKSYAEVIAESEGRAQALATAHHRQSSSAGVIPPWSDPVATLEQPADSRATASEDVKSVTPGGPPAPIPDPIGGVLSVCAEPGLPGVAASPSSPGHPEPSASAPISASTVAIALVAHAPHTGETPLDLPTPVPSSSHSPPHTSVPTPGTRSDAEPGMPPGSQAPASAPAPAPVSEGGSRRGQEDGRAGVEFEGRVSGQAGGGVRGKGGKPGGGLGVDTPSWPHGNAPPVLVTAMPPAPSMIAGTLPSPLVGNLPLHQSGAGRRGGGGASWPGAGG
ncbi:unnamed protein product, partial [Discosporangium mesarthrocarpum]